MDELTPRERVRRTLRRQPADRMPLTLDTGGGAGISGPYLRIFRERTGCTGVGEGDPAEYFDFDIRVVSTPLVAHANDFTQYHPVIPPGTVFDEFGVGRLSSETFPLGLHLSPWQHFTTIQEMLDYPFPTFAMNRAIQDQIDAFHARGYAVSTPAGSINEWCYYLRTMEEFMTDLGSRQELAELLLDKVTDLAAIAGAGMAAAGVDVVCFYGDVGGQRNLLMSQRMWRQWIRPRWQKIFDAVHAANPEALVFFHSCGYIEPIINDLIEVGIDVLNPIQPETMDPYKIRREYGERVALWGGVGLQSTMQAADPEVVRQEVRRLKGVWSPGGIVTVANSMPVDIPWDNVVALVETIKE